VPAATVRSMISTTHEAVLDVFRNRPSLVPRLLAGALGVDVPVHEHVRLEPGELTDLAPTEFRADAVVVLRGAGEAPVLAVVVEVQLRRAARKRRSWPAYVATLHARWGCPTALLVVCVDTGVARWCARPIEFGPGWRGSPLVLGPDQVPVTSRVEDIAGTPELAVLSALAHGGEPQHRDVLDVLSEALAQVEIDRADLYAELVLAALPRAAHDHLEALMTAGTYPYQSRYARKLLAQGKAEGKAADVLMVLDARGIEVPDEIRARVTDCADLDQLDRWLRRAVTAASAHDLFS
jgi:hypothetical protein